jgi:hypothetical protein
MNRNERLELAKLKGYTCNFETGQVFGLKGKELKGKNGGGYINISICEKKIQIQAHHFIWYMYYGEDVPEGYFIDHINRVRTDNRIINLRVVTHQENAWNTDAKGFYWHKPTKKWKSQITVNNKKIHLGYFDTEEEAHQVYLDAKKKYHKN